MTDDYRFENDILIDPADGPPSIGNESVPFYAQDGCIICGAPENAAPNLIKFIDDDGNIEPKEPTHADYHCAFVQQPKTKSDLLATFDAMMSSCIDCVRYRGTDEFVLQLMRENGVSGYADALTDIRTED